MMAFPFAECLHGWFFSESAPALLWLVDGTSGKPGQYLRVLPLCLAQAVYSKALGGVWLLFSTFSKASHCMGCRAVSHRVAFEACAPAQGFNFDAAFRLPLYPTGYKHLQ